MKVFVSFISIILFSPNLLASTLLEFKDWKAERKLIDSVGQRGCVAETVTTDNDGTEYHLQVIRLKTSNGLYSKPLILSFSLSAIDDFFEAESKSSGSSKIYSMTLFQPKGQDQKLVASRLEDSDEIVKKLRAHNRFDIKFIHKDDTIKSIPFSLRGSSKVIKTIFNEC